MKVKNILTGLVFDFPIEEAKKTVEEDPDIFVIDEELTAEEKKQFEKVKVDKPITIDNKILGDIDFERMSYNNLCSLAREYGLNPFGKKKNEIIEMIKG